MTLSLSEQDWIDEIHLNGIRNTTRNIASILQISIFKFPKFDIIIQWVFLAEIVIEPLAIALLAYI